MDVPWGWKEYGNFFLGGQSLICLKWLVSFGDDLGGICGTACEIRRNKPVFFPLYCSGKGNLNLNSQRTESLSQTLKSLNAVSFPPFFGGLSGIIFKTATNSSNLFGCVFPTKEAPHHCPG